MATYRYECPACGEFEADHPMDVVLARCKGCGEPVKRLIPSSVGINGCSLVSREIADERRRCDAMPKYEGPTRADLPSSSEKKRVQEAVVMKDLESIRKAKAADRKIRVSA